MADELRLDIIVDDHGAAEKLSNVDAGVAKVVERAQSGKGTLDELGKSFGVNTVNLSAFTSETAVAEAGLSALGLTAGIGTGAFIALAAGFKMTVEQAVALHQAADGLGGDAAKFSQVAEAAGDVAVSQDKLVAIMDRLTDRIESGKIDGGLRTLGVELEHLKSADPSDQLKQVASAIGEIEAPAAQARARLMALGEDSPEAARLMKQSFKEAADGASGMSKEAIAAFNAVGEAWEHLKNRVSQAPSTLFGKSFDAFVNLRRNIGVDAEAPPTPPQAPHVNAPEGPEAPDIARDEALMRGLELQRQITEEGYHYDEAMRSIAAAQALIVKSGGDWATVLNTRVAAAVDNINAKYTQAVLMNSQLGGDAKTERDRLAAKLTATTNPNESEYDRRFNEIDQDAKRKLALVNQTGRGGQAGNSAADAENAILEEMNLKVQALQQEWEGVGKKTDDVKAKTESLRSTYNQIGAGGGQPGGGTALQGGLVMPTAEQVANHRYFGPVTPNGQPDASRMGGAAPMTTNIHINAPGSVNTEGWDALVQQLETALDERDKNLGGRVSR